MNERKKKRKTSNNNNSNIEIKNNNQVFVHITTQSVCFQYAHGLQRLKTHQPWTRKGQPHEKRGKHIVPNGEKKQQQQHQRIRNKNRNAY